MRQLAETLVGRSELSSLDLALGDLGRRGASAAMGAAGAVARSSLASWAGG